MMMLRPIIRWSALVFLWGLVSCSGAASPSTDSHAPAPPSVAVETAPTTTVSTAPSSAETTSTTASAATGTVSDSEAGEWPEVAPDVLLGTTEGVLLRDQPYAASGRPVDKVVDDLEGGVVFQTATDIGETSELWWLPTGSEEPLPLLELAESGGFRGSLHQVAEIDGERMLVVTRDIAPGGVEPEEYLELAELTEKAEPDRRVTLTGGPEWGAQSVSYAAEAFLIVDVNDACGDIKLVDLSGAPIAAPGLPEPPCEVHFEVPFLHGRLSPDGSLLAYVAQNYQFDAELGYPIVIRSHLVVSDLDTGDDVLREQITDPAGEQIVAMDFDGEWLVWVVGASSGETEPFPTGSEIFGHRLDATRFQARVEDVRSVWLPREPLKRS